MRPSSETFTKQEVKVNKIPQRTLRMKIPRRYCKQLGYRNTLGVLLYVVSSAASENIVHAHTVWGVGGGAGELIDVIVTRFSKTKP